MAAMLCLLYSGCLSNGVAYTLQIVAQKGMNPTVASLIMSLESAVGAVAGWLILGQVLTGREILGCVIMPRPSSWRKFRRAGSKFPEKPTDHLSDKTDPSQN